MVRRGLTLLEIVVALALVLSITAMVAPPVLRRLDERSFTAACDLLSQQMLLARAHAAAVGSGVEVVHDFETHITRARLFVAAPLDQGDPRDGSLAQDLGDADGRAITEPWSERRLHGGLTITDADPRDDEDALYRTSFEPFDDALDQGALASLEPLRLAVFLPDGSALLGAPIWVKDDDGRIARLTTNPLTGLVSIERLDGTLAADEETPDDEDELDEGLDDEAPDDAPGREERDRGRPEPDPPAAPPGDEPGASDPPGTGDQSGPGGDDDEDAGPDP